jgi:hypothetical protein|tara:strand:+ start:292 stop:492 length:201 start_codon:yes stop_codon:yes gene_type:complete
MNLYSVRIMFRGQADRDIEVLATNLSIARKTAIIQARAFGIVLGSYAPRLVAGDAVPVEVEVRDDV